MKIESIMQPVSRPLGPDTSVSEAARLLESEALTALPVLNYDGTLLGVITAQDMLAASAGASDNAVPRVIAELVRPGGLNGTLTDDVQSLANKARCKKHTHVTVVDGRGNLVGIADLSPYQGSLQDDQHREDALDGALKESFPASDPISPP